MKPPFILLGAVLIVVQGARSFAQDSGSPMAGPDVSATVLKGVGVTRPAPKNAVTMLPAGTISLDFPSVDVQAVAKSILGDTLNVPYSLDPNLHALVTIKTVRAIRRQDVIGVLEPALARANLVLLRQGGAYAILPAGSARAQAPAVGPNDEGFGNETVPLKFVNAEEMRKLLEPLVPGAVSTSDQNQNVLVISGTSAERKALRDLVAEFDVNWLRGMSFALFVPQRTDARLIAPELDKLLNGPGAPTAGMVRLIGMDSLNGILAITAQPQYLEDTRRFVEILDREGESAEKRVFVYRVQNGRAADLAKVLNSAFGNGSGGGGSGYGQDSNAPTVDDHTAPAASTIPPPPTNGSPGGVGRPSTPVANSFGGTGQPQGGGASTGATITADEINNAVVVYATPRTYALVSEALAKLDVPPLQVMIDASIAEVTLDHNDEYGIQWSFVSGRNAAALTQGTTGTPVQNFPGFSYLYTGNGISATINALRKVNDVNVLSSPKLMVLNNRTATIQVGNQVPISTGSAINLTNSAPLVNSIEYRDTGVILKITPRVNSGGLVLLDIAQEVSDVSNTTTSGIDSPSFTQRKIATSVAVQDGETIALGGLIKNQVEKGRSTVPLLGEIPVLGHLFGDTTHRLQRTELVVLLSPHVVRAPIDVRAVTRELMEKIHVGAPDATPPPVRRARRP